MTQRSQSLSVVQPAVVVMAVSPTHRRSATIPSNQGQRPEPLPIKRQKNTFDRLLHNVLAKKLNPTLCCRTHTCGRQLQAL
jgi:hypothetical protein